MGDYILGAIGILLCIGLFAALMVGIVKLEDASNKSYQVQQEKWDADPTNPINICRSKGGVPITSAWDGRLKDCQFK